MTSCQKQKREIRSADDVYYHSFCIGEENHLVKPLIDMSYYKNQHFVPQFLLKNFSADKKCITLCLKDSARIIDRVSIKGQCSKSNFYVSKAFEKALGNFESISRETIQKLINREFNSLSQQDFNVLKSFLLLQKERTLHKVRFFRDGMEQVREHVRSIGMTDEFRKEFERYENTEKDVVMLMMSTFKTALEITADLRCKVLIYEGTGSFISSDDPVVVYNPLLESFSILNYGLAAIGLLLILPVSPKITIIVYDDCYYKIGKRNESIVRCTSQEDISLLNLLTVLHSDKSIYYQEGSQNPHDILRLVTRANGIGNDGVMKMATYVAEDGESELIHSYANHFAIGAKFSFLKILDKAREIRFGKTLGVTDYSRLYCLQIMRHYDTAPPIKPMRYHRK